MTTATTRISTPAVMMSLRLAGDPRWGRAYRGAGSGDRHGEARRVVGEARGRGEREDLDRARRAERAAGAPLGGRVVDLAQRVLDRHLRDDLAGVEARHRSADAVGPVLW